MNLEDIEIQHNQCFVTPIYELQLGSGEELEARNRDLKAAVHAIRAAGESGYTYEGAGWQTPHDLHKRSAFGELFEVMQRILLECSKAEALPSDQRPVIHAAWSNIESPGDAVRVHMHPWSVWSGVYYVDVDDRTGDLFFVDPRPGAKATVWPHADKLSRGMVQFHPRPGMLILFPSWLEHYTDPNRSDRERMCIAFNASLGTPGQVPRV